MGLHEYPQGFLKLCPRLILPDAEVANSPSMPVYYYRDNITPGDKSELRGIAEEAAKIVESVADPVNLLRGKIMAVSRSRWCMYVCSVLGSVAECLESD